MHLGLKTQCAGPRGESSPIEDRAAAGTVAALADGNRLLRSRAREQAVSSKIPFRFPKRRGFSQIRKAPVKLANDLSCRDNSLAVASLNRTFWSRLH